MAYERVSFPLAAGMNTKVEDTILSQPNVRLAYNTQTPRTGGYTRRRGYARLGGGDSIFNSGTFSTSKATAAYKDSVVSLSGTNLYEYSVTADKWVDRGDCPVSRLSVTGVECPSEFTPFASDMAVTSTGYTVYVALVATSALVFSVDMTIVDSAGTTMGRRRLSTLAGTAGWPRITAVGARAWIVWGDGTTLNCFVADCTSATTVNSTLTVTAVVAAAADLNGTTTGTIDVAPRPSGGNVLVAYCSNTLIAGALREVKWGFLSTSGTLSGTSTYDAGVGITPTSISCCVESSEALHGIAYLDGANPNDVYALHRSWNGAAWTATASSAAIDTALAANPSAIACIYDNSTTLRVFHSENTTSMRTYQSTYTTGGVATARTVTLRHTHLSSKPFFYSSALYFWGWQCGTESTSQAYTTDDPTLFLFRASDGIPVARALPGTAFLSLPVNVTVSGSSNAVVTCAALEFQRNYASGGSLLGALATRRLTVEFNNSENYRLIEDEDTLQIPGAIVKQYDGTYVTETGFLRFPTTNSWATPTASNGAGSLTNSKQYYYNIIVEWTNARGRRELGTSSGSKDVTLGVADDTVTIVIDTISATLKQGSIPDLVFGIYRTDDSSPSSNSVFYRVGQIVNDPTADTVTFTDLMSDSDAVNQEQLYLGTGELDNVAFPPCHIIASGNGRVAVAGAENPNTIYLSKYRQDGRGLEHNDALLIQCPSDGGDITGLAWLNSTLIIFKERLLYYVRGDGPNNLGVGIFTEPELLSSDTGCVTQHSIVLTPLGLMFQGSKGIMLLDQGMQVSYIGAPLEDIDTPGASPGTIVGAVLVPDEQRVQFSDATYDFVFDYYHRQWHVWSFGGAGPGCVYGGVHVKPRSGRVYAQSDSVHIDDTATNFYARVDLAFTSAPDSPLSTFSIRKVAVLGEVYGTSAITASFSYDSARTVVERIEETGLAAGALRKVWRVGRHVTNQFALTLTDADLTGSPTYTSTAGMVWTSVTFELKPRNGLRVR